MKEISDLFDALLENEFLLFAVIVAFVPSCFFTLQRFICGSDFYFLDFIRDSFPVLKKFISNLFARFKVWFFKYQTDDQDTAE